MLLLTALKLDNTHACDSDDDDANVSTNPSTNTKTSKGYEPAYAPKGYKSESVVARGNEDFTDLSNPVLPCVLLKAVLVVLGVVARPEGKGLADQSLNESEKRKVMENEREDEKGRERAAGRSAVTMGVESFEQRLNRLCSLSPSASASTPPSISISALSSSSSNSSSPVKGQGQGQGQGLEIVCCSELPAGSGKLAPSAPLYFMLHTAYYITFFVSSWHFLFLHQLFTFFFSPSLSTTSSSTSASTSSYPTSSSFSSFPPSLIFSSTDHSLSLSFIHLFLSIITPHTLFCSVTLSPPPYKCIHTHTPHTYTYIHTHTHTLSLTLTYT